MPYCAVPYHTLHYNIPYITLHYHCIIIIITLSLSLHYLYNYITLPTLRTFHIVHSIPLHCNTKHTYIIAYTTYIAYITYVTYSTCNTLHTLHHYIHYIQHLQYLHYIHYIQYLHYIRYKHYIHHIHFIQYLQYIRYIWTIHYIHYIHSIHDIHSSRIGAPYVHNTFLVTWHDDSTSPKWRPPQARHQPRPAPSWFAAPNVSGSRCPWWGQRRSPPSPAMVELWPHGRGHKLASGKHTKSY